MSKMFDLNAEIICVIREIMNYKWLESEKEGHDIGLNRASKEWISRYYDSWFQYNAKKFIKDC
jgi:hypothetical protein